MAEGTASSPSEWLVFPTVEGSRGRGGRGPHHRGSTPVSTAAPGVFQGSRGLGVHPGLRQRGRRCQGRPSLRNGGRRRVCRWGVAVGSASFSLPTAYGIAQALGHRHWARVAGLLQAGQGAVLGPAMPTAVLGLEPLRASARKPFLRPVAQGHLAVVLLRPQLGHLSCGPRFGQDRGCWLWPSTGPCMAAHPAPSAPVGTDSSQDRLWADSIPDSKPL